MCLTITTDNDVDFGEDDSVTLTATSENDPSVDDDLIVVRSQNQRYQGDVKAKEAKTETYVDNSVLDSIEDQFTGSDKDFILKSKKKKSVAVSKLKPFGTDC